MNELLPVALLAGGLATRLKSLTTTIPKSLVLINDEPFISHQLRLLKLKGIKEVVMCIGHLGDLIQAFVGDGSRFELNVQYVTDGDRLLGTGGAIKNALPLLGENFFVLNGDSYLMCDYLAVQQTFFSAKKPALMTVFKNEGQWDTSNIQYEAPNIVAYDKIYLTPHMHYIDYGLTVLNRSVFVDIDNTPLDLALLLQNLLKKNQLAAFLIKERFYEIGSFAGIRELAYYLNPELTSY